MTKRIIKKVIQKNSKNLDTEILKQEIQKLKIKL